MTFRERLPAVATLCTYSAETVSGCRHYRPVSEHGDFPEAAECVCVLNVPLSNHQRRRICGRVAEELQA